MSVKQHRRLKVSCLYISIAISHTCIIDCILKNDMTLKSASNRFSQFDSCQQGLTPLVHNTNVDYTEVSMTTEQLGYNNCRQRRDLVQTNFCCFIYGASH